MAGREAIEKLVASRKAYKAWVTKNRTRLLNAWEAYTEGEDPSKLEEYLEVYKNSFEKYQTIDEEISLAPESDGGDLDKDSDQLLDDFFTTKIKIQGFRREFDKAQLPVQPAVVQANNNNQDRRTKRTSNVAKT